MASADNQGQPESFPSPGDVFRQLSEYIDIEDDTLLNLGSPIMMQNDFNFDESFETGQPHKMEQSEGSGSSQQAHTSHHQSVEIPTNTGVDPTATKWTNLSLSPPTPSSSILHPILNAGSSNLPTSNNTNSSSQVQNPDFDLSVFSMPSHHETPFQSTNTPGYNTQGNLPQGNMSATASFQLGGGGGGGGYQQYPPLISSGSGFNHMQAMQGMSGTGSVVYSPYSGGYGTQSQYPAPPDMNTMLPAVAQPPPPPVPQLMPMPALQPSANINNINSSNSNNSLDPEWNKNSKKLTHSRKLKRKNDPSLVYRNFGPTPAWGYQDKRGSPIYKYSPKGIELEMTRRFSVDNLWRFFKGIGPPDCLPMHRTLLTLWIQNVPSQDNNRYHHGGMSPRCRYEGCPAQRGTILKGFFRMAFDELSDQTGQTADPFLNAGYIHLFCFEKLFDLPMMLQNEASLGFRIRPDFRTFDHETKNPMSLTRDYPQIEEAYHDWLYVQKQKVRAHLASQNGNHTAERPRTKDDCLWKWLTRTQLEVEGQGRKQLRQKRAGADIDKHQGDLELYLKMKVEIKEKKTKRKMHQIQGGGHHYGDVDDDMDDDDDDDVDDDYVEDDGGEGHGDDQSREEDEGGAREPPRKRVRQYSEDRPGSQHRTSPRRREGRGRPPPRSGLPQTQGQGQDQDQDQDQDRAELANSTLATKLGSLAGKRLTRKRSQEMAEIVEEASRTGVFRQGEEQQLASLVDGEPPHKRRDLRSRPMRREDGESLELLLGQLTTLQQHAVKTLVQKQLGSHAAKRLATA